MSTEAKVTVSGGGSGSTFKVSVDIGGAVGGSFDVDGALTGYQALHTVAPFIEEWLNMALQAGAPKKGKTLPPDAK